MGSLWAKTDFFLVNTIYRPFGHNVDIKRAIAKKRICHSVQKNSASLMLIFYIFEHMGTSELEGYLKTVQCCSGARI